MHARQPRREWLEADGLGGFASGTADLVRTRRYHALLCAATTPPTGRMVLVAGQDVDVRVGDDRQPLGVQAYGAGVLHPRGDTHVVAFEHEPWPRWEFAFANGMRIAHELFVPHGSAAVVQRWEMLSPPASGEPVELRVRPFLAGRDYHTLRRETDGFRVVDEPHESGVRWQLSHGSPDILTHGNGTYTTEPLWYRGFLYEDERERGYDAHEDLLAPGTLVFDLRRGPADLVFAAGSLPTDLRDVDFCRARERTRRAAFASPLHRAADAYVVARDGGRSLIAGYPWFTDWGRDTFLSIRGLCLATGRLDVARDVLCEWARHVSGGMLPNRFPDQGDVAEYHTADAALWFVVAADEFLRRTDPSPRDRSILESAIRSIVDGYAAGTRHGIAMDRSDGLLRAGERGLQITWMDAVVDGKVVTPRIGKPVELQTLWFNAVTIAARFEPRWREVAQRVRRSFEERFWDHEHRWLCDVVDADHVPGAIDSRLRCNQILAIGGLPHALFDGPRAIEVVAAVERELLTPFGLRTLAHRETGYAPVCSGDVRQRDLAYHNGTVWPWLIGPFVEAWLRVHGDTAANRAAARARFVRPLFRHLDAAGLGHVSEIFDGDAPHTPRGCPFQAWSLGELLRIEAVLSAPTHASTKEDLSHAIA